MSFRGALSAVVATILISAIAVLPGSPASAAPPEIAGVVLDNVDSPIAGVEVDVVGTGATATTDSAGEFAVAVPSGSHDVRFTPPVGSGLQVHLVGDVDADATSRLIVRLQRVSLVSLSGRITDSHGHPVANATLPAALRRETRCRRP